MVAATAGSVGANEFAGAQRESAPGTYDGFRGNADIRTNPITVNGITFAHSTQMDTGAVGGEFVAIGTYKGEGAGVAPDRCVDDYDGAWSIYTDGVLNSMYFCETEAEDQYVVGDNPSFAIIWGFCLSQSANRWLMYHDGGLWACYDATDFSRGAAAVLETAGSPPSTTDRNIDVKFTNLNVNRSNGGDWLVFGSIAAVDIILSPDYTYGWISNTAHNSFLAPLN